MQRKRAQVRRVEILSATVKQIQSRGMAALRISDVASSLGVSPALVVYHFETKENLLAEALRHAAERDLLKLRRIMRSSGSATERLMAALHWYAPTGRARGWIVWVDGWAAAMWDKTIAQVLTDLQQQWTDAIAELIEEGVRDGAFTVADAHDAASRITALLDGLAVRTIVHGGRLKRDALSGWLVQQAAWELGTTDSDLATTMTS
ncbi:MAG: TetR/AcrR family transcriptional regulator [Nocardioidaceae bacterium]